MSRGGRTKSDDEGCERRCIVTGQSSPKEGLIRFVIGPDALVVPDLAEKLPGRGLWLSADRAVLDKAISKNAFCRAARAKVALPEDFIALIEALLLKRAIASISLCRKAGCAVAGAEKCREASFDATALIQAQDGADGGKRKMRAAIRNNSGDVPEFSCLTSEELGLAFGRNSVIHAVLTHGGAADRAIRACAKLQGMRPGDTEASQASAD
ncbi:MAG: RNA-binding protein [Neomegalonema sp.]|nr:RNA-binding protein [Neomegalonema sp.]